MICGYSSRDTLKTAIKLNKLQVNVDVSNAIITRVHSGACSKI